MAKKQVGKSLVNGCFIRDKVIILNITHFISDKVFAIKQLLRNYLVVPQ